MAFEGLKLLKIHEDHLQALLGTAESRQLDFKRQYNAGDGGEIGADVSAFANTIGGHIIVGMEEDKAGIAVELMGVAGNADTELSRLQNMILSNIQPRVTGLDIHPVPLKNGSTAFVISIPRSLNAPHRVTSSRRFWIRAGTLRTEPDVDELRTLFTSGLTLQHRLREYRHLRVAKIRAGDTPVTVIEGGAAVLHIIPSDAFQNGRLVSIKELRNIQGSFYSKFRPIKTTGGISFLTRLEGYGAYSVPEPSNTYTLVNRNGIVEAVTGTVHWLYENSYYSHFNEIFEIVESAFKYLQGLRELEFRPPLTVFITLYGMKGTLLKVGQGFSNPHSIQHDYIPLTEVVLDDYPDTLEEFIEFCRPLLEEVANAAGFEDAPTSRCDRH